MPDDAVPSTAAVGGRWLVAIFLVALAVRLLHLWQLSGTPFASVLMGDARGYDQWARRLAGGDWIGTDVFYQAPLYPYFLGLVYRLFGADPMTARIVQAVLGSVSAVLVMVAATRLVSPRAGRIAGLLLALYAPAIFFDSLLQKSVLDVCFVAGAMAALAMILTGDASRRRWWLALGLATGALALTRENALVLVAVFAGWIAWSAPTGTLGRGRALAVLAAGLLLVLTPVALRNYAVSGDLYLTTSQFGPNFYIGNHAGADGSYQSLRFGRGSPEFERVDATELAERATGRTLTPAEVSSYWSGRAWTFITSEPVAWLRLMARKAALLVNASEAIDTESQESYAEWSWPLAALGWLTHFGVLVPLAIVGVWWSWPDRRRFAVFLAMGGAFAVSTLAFYVFARYRYPLVPLLLFFAGTALASAREIAATLPARGTIGALVAAAVAAVGCQWPLLSPTRSQAITETNLGTALYDARRYDEALARYRRALAVQPDYVPAFNNLGVALRAAGRTDEALQAYRDGLALRDDYPDLHYNLANALLALNHQDEAAEHLRKAAATNGDSAGVHNNLGIALAAQGQLAAAAEEFARAVALEPTSARAHRNLGNALGELGRRDEALAHLTQATTLGKDDPENFYDLGAFLLTLDRSAEAATAFTTALQLRPAYPEAHNNLGIALGGQGDLAGAIAHFEEALRQSPGFEDAARNLDTARRARRAQ